ncbi:MAG: DNA mismatch repair endonuclease MutL [Phycisphaerae bacterium]|nr:DNA mismatch repair endonuclease MutL [Phycisphaerae bacterium]
MPIAKLSMHLVNKIAAGEVIERPASVVKELVENALDAGASRVDVSVEDGGKQLIQVTDDGSGMGKDDAALAFEPHATSKIAAEDDLFAIGTMGFRGEALASVASISHARIRTRRPDDEGGWEVAASGETVEPPVPCAAAVGTTVTIRDLFFNTPARRKFLRTTNTEFGHVSEQIARLALPHPRVAFTLRHNNRETLNLPACDNTRRRIADLFTPDLAESLLPIVQRTGPVRVAGLLGPPSAARSSAKWQYIFLNGRYIRDRLLGHALREAFRGLLAPNRYPAVFLFLEIDPADVDVNVHPTKIEVRFRDSNRVYGEVLASLRETLQKSDLRPDVEGEFDTAARPEEPRQESLRQALADFFKSTPPPQPRLSFPEGIRRRENCGLRNADCGLEELPSLRDKLRHGDSERRYPGTLLSESQSSRSEIVSPAPQEESSEYIPTETATEDIHPDFPAIPLMQVHDSYIVAQTADGLMIVDQHALHERILYNEFHRRLTSGRLTAQRMLIPRTVQVSPAEAALLEESTELLAKLGIEVAPFGPNTWAVQQYPTVLAERGVKMDAFFRELLDALNDDETTDPERLLEAVLAMMACKAAVKAGQPLRQEEMRQLLAGLDEVDKSSACPHGRPTTLRMTLKDLHKQFQRT